MFHKNNRKKYLCHFGEDDIMLNGFILNLVHYLPEGEWSTEQEIDFYMDDTKDIYLLRIINSNKNTITLSDCTNDIRYIIIHIPVVNTLDALNVVTYKLQRFKYSQKISEYQQLFNFE